MNLVKRLTIVALFLSSLTFGGCFHYSFTGTSIPSDIHSIYIPFFPDQSSSGLGDLSNMLNKALVNRFVNQSRLHLANDQGNSDIVLSGVITSYHNGPFSISGNQKASLNRVDITVTATYKYTKDKKTLWQKSFNGFDEFDPNKDPINGEKTAAKKAMEQIAGKMFDESVGKW